MLLTGLLVVFFVIGAPSWGGHGGFDGGSSVSGGLGGYQGGSNFRPPALTMGNNRIPLMGWFTVVLFFIGMIGVLQLFAKPKKEKWQKQYFLQPVALQPLTMAVLLIEDVEAHISFFDEILRHGDFATPVQRASIVRRLSTRIASASFHRAHYRMLPQQLTSYDAVTVAEMLAKHQKERVDTHREPDRDSKSLCCVVGITITLAPAFVTNGSRSSDDIYGCHALWRKLRTVPASALDAAYLFYSPSAGETLTVAQGEAMLSDLRDMTIQAPL